MCYPIKESRVLRNIKSPLWSLNQDFIIVVQIHKVKEYAPVNRVPPEVAQGKPRYRPSEIPPNGDGLFHRFYRSNADVYEVHPNGARRNVSMERRRRNSYSD